jgi:phenylalanyl-tRNA synthetase beta chain
MRFPETWLRTLVNLNLTSEALADALTMAGLEVEALERIDPTFRGVVVAQVIAVEPHPNTDRLRVCQVDIGDNAPLSVVCGAPNVTKGMRAPLALVGATLGGKAIERATLRGIESFGMLCSEHELGLSDNANGLMVLPADVPLGQDLARYLDLEDSVFTLKLTPNRGDCLSLRGVAREAAAITGSALRPLSIETVTGELEAQRAITLEDGRACPRYCGRAIRLERAHAPTPRWIKDRLERSGLRCIHAVVDVTNYVMLELGQPLHAFDHEKLEGGISVRWGRKQERLTLLNQQVVELDSTLLVIADQSGPVALAGVMGGKDTEVSEGSREIFLESAFFAPSAIAGRARRLGLPSDAAHRFERGVDFAATRMAIERATRLILDICGGRAGKISEAIGELPHRAPVRVRPERVSKLLGTLIEEREIIGVLNKIEITTRRIDAAIEAIAPTHRFDLAIEADFVEEIARIHGYDNIAPTPPEGKAVLLPRSEARSDCAKLAAILAARGYQEVVTYSFVDEALERDFAGNTNPIRLRNPIASDMGAMRSTLASGLFEALRFNLNRKQERVRVFEIGKCFLPSVGPSRGESTDSMAGFHQTLKLGGLHFGAARPEQWGEAARNADFFDIKGDIELLFHDLKFLKNPHVALHPGRSVAIQKKDKLVGWIGELNPRFCQRYDLVCAPIMFEVELEPLLDEPVPMYTEVSRFPPSRRDISALFAEEVEVSGVLQTLRDVAPEGVTEVALYDVYRGSGIPKAKKSLAFRIVMNDTEKTLTEEEIEHTRQFLSQVLVSRFKAELRK